MLCKTIGRGFMSALVMITVLSNADADSTGFTWTPLNNTTVAAQTPGNNLNVFSPGGASNPQNNEDDAPPSAWASNVQGEITQIDSAVATTQKNYITTYSVVSS